MHVLPALLGNLILRLRTFDQVVSITTISVYYGEARNRIRLKDKLAEASGREIAECLVQLGPLTTSTATPIPGYKQGFMGTVH